MLFVNAPLKTVYQVWNAPHTLGKTDKNSVQYLTPVPIYFHPGLLPPIPSCLHFKKHVKSPTPIHILHTFPNPYLLTPPPSISAIPTQSISSNPSQFPALHAAYITQPYSIYTGPFKRFLTCVTKYTQKDC